MTLVLAIDPGPEQSAYVCYDNGALLSFGKIGNDELLDVIRRTSEPVVIEMIASYGMAVGAEVFETCVWIGRFMLEAERTELADAPFGTPRTVARVYRREVKLHLCGQARAKDGNVRQAVLDRYGGKDKAIGRKATPGPLYGVKADCWQALALAITYSDTALRSAVA